MGITVRARAVTRIGTRMARPEKAKERLLSPPPHALFPVGNAGGAQRFIDTVARSAQSEKRDENGRTFSRKKAGAVNASVGLRVCPECGANTILCHCDCGAHTVPRDKPQVTSIAVDELLEKAAERINEPMPEKLKGVIGLISKNRTPEPLEKGILRWKHGIHVNKDGTIRYDMTDVPLTHFRPRKSVFRWRGQGSRVRTGRLRTAAHRRGTGLRAQGPGHRAGKGVRRLPSQGRRLRG